VALAIALVVAYHACALIRKVLIRLRTAATDSTSTVLSPDQGEPVMSGEVGEVLDVERREREVVGEAARGDPGVVDRAGRPR
jgi:hypothetical protein